MNPYDQTSSAVRIVSGVKNIMTPMEMPLTGYAEIGTPELMRTGFAMRQRGEPMDDLISRQAAIDALNKRARDTFTLVSGYQYYLGALHDVGDDIKKLPSAERKKGKWIDSGIHGFVCSVCKNGYRDQPTLMGKPLFEFCPVCGADMRGEEHG